uniref:Uncharacterized protein n=1 Tax=Utricularia reniformis TaxID=192314 RepID=A0A1Y0B1K6_9LAMI|nr:hypothetical protein AEK19_MT1119 [Utricularia reniformis]ART31336.1 hypothetical protein AEK19_MT1119 [Utricularia reniformis]
MNSLKRKGAQPIPSLSFSLQALQEGIFLLLCLLSYSMVSILFTQHWAYSNYSLPAFSFLSS